MLIGVGLSIDIWMNFICFSVCSGDLFWFGVCVLENFIEGRLVKFVLVFYDNVIIYDFDVILFLSLLWKIMINF